MTPKNLYSSEEIEKISDSVSVLDYFFHLERQGKVKFDRKTGHDHYFRTENNKFSVNEEKFYDFKTGNGGKIIKAVMDLENKSWKEAIDFLKDFSNIEIPSLVIAEREKIKRSATNSTKSVPTSIISPNNSTLLNYFQNRGIDSDIIQKNTQQVHYQVSGKKYFGIGLKNESGGYEIRNPMMKNKIGKSDISILQGTKNEAVVFEGMTDMLSFLQICKDRNVPNQRTLVVLNSVTNTGEFLEKFKDFTGKIHLILDGDKAGNEATEKICETLKNSIDAREKYGISDGKHNDLNDYLINSFKPRLILEKNRTFTQNNIQNIQENEPNQTKSEGISRFEPMGREPFRENDNRINQTSQSQHENTNGSTETMDSHDAGNGLTASTELNLYQQRGLDSGYNAPMGEQLASENSSTNHRENGNDERGGIEGKIPSVEAVELGGNETKNNRERNALKLQKSTNEQITELVNDLTEVIDNKVVIKENAEITSEVENVVSQYKSGGVAKSGRGILDEYYTNEKLVQAVGNLIKDNFKNQKEISVLEPSVGTGNFLSALKNLEVKTKVTAFEINGTTAKISKILNPNIEVNLRSFETEFITENGLKKNFEPKYDLVIGNPPYGEHRGLYKGLGEEPKIAKYEDYFIKRSLDVLKESGTLAMVVPSGWLNRQKNLQNAELQQAYRLPNGVFKSTDIGTDIIILKKNSSVERKDISQYFDQNPSRILGDLGQKTNRFGKLEDYVKGNLDKALQLLERHQKQQEKITQRVSGTQLDLFDLSQSAEKELVAEKETKKGVEQKTSDIIPVLEKVNLVLENLQKIKFKSLAVVNEIEIYENLKTDLEKNADKFSAEYLEEVSKKAENIIKIHSKKKIESSEYLVQNTPEIKKKVLKYNFQKEDELVGTNTQNSKKLSKEEIEAFRDTDYAGRLQNPEKHQKFANEHLGEWIHDFYYAEGDIYEKLEILENHHSKGKMETAQYEKQKSLLESVLPPKKSLEDIIILPNHEFVHQFSLGEEEREVRKQTGWNYGGRNPSPVYSIEKQMLEVTLAMKFKEFINKLPREAFGNSSSWEVSGFVDNEQVTGSDKERNALVRERRKEVANDLFNKFLREELSDVEKEKFVNEFNRKYNNIHIPNYKEFPLFSQIHKNFKGKPLELTEVQKAGIGRLTTKGVGLLAHEVGFGKTLSGVLSMHEAMERGNAKRPLIVVPNDSILKQWVETIFETIPNAKVNILGNLGKDYDLSKFDNKDGEISLVTYEGFNNIGFSHSTVGRLADKFSYISEQEEKVLKYSERDIQKEIQQRQETEGKMRRGKLYDWEDFGFDHLTFDEVHNANHIIGKVRIEDKRYASDFRSQNQATSLLGMNTWVASQYIQDKYDGRNVSLLSATPFTNKPLEYYSILSLIANDRLEKSGYFNVNTFFETFMEADNDMEIDAKGDIKYKTNVRRFKNNALFQQLLGEFIDIKGEEDNPELKRPNRINKEYKIEQNDLTKEAYERLNESFDESEKGAILMHILNARLIAISPYLAKDYDGETPTTKEFIENSPKLKTTMDLIAQNKKDQPNAGQIIYSELGVAEFPKLKEYLVNNVGYKADEVAIITGATKKEQRLDIQEKFNDGKIKIVIGSEAIQEGMNLQKKTSDMYLLSLPYNFTSLRQTEGRAWRQGNEWKNVRINFMLTNDSIDVFMLQKLQAKQARYMEAMKNGANIIDVSDVDTSELKTALITDPITRAEIEISVVKKRLENEMTRHKADLGFISRKFENYVKSKEYEQVKGLKSDLEKYTHWENESNKGIWKQQIQWTSEKLAEHLPKLEKLENQLLEKGINIKEFQLQKEKTEEKIAQINDKIENELPLEKEKLIQQYKAEKEEKLKNYNPIDFVKEREEENKSFYILRPKEEKENNYVSDMDIAVYERYKGDNPNSETIKKTKDEVNTYESSFKEALKVIFEEKPNFLEKSLEKLTSVRAGESVINFKNIDGLSNREVYNAIHSIENNIVDYLRCLRTLNRYYNNSSENLPELHLSPFSNERAKVVLDMIFKAKELPKYAEILNQPKKIEDKSLFVNQPQEQEKSRGFRR